MKDRHEFLSDGWILMLQQEAQRLFDAVVAKPGAKIVYVEMLTESPSPRQDGLQAGYSLTFEAGKVTVHSGVRPAELADCTVRMNYAAALATMRVKAGPELNELGKKGFADGKLAVSGPLEVVPIPMNSLHDVMCEKTLLIAERKFPS